MHAFDPRCSILAVALASAALAPGTALADEPAPVASDKEAVKKAREQFERAMQLQTEDDWAGALALLREVAQVKATPQVLFNVALCEENLGQLVAAHADYGKALEAARQQKADDVAEQAQKHAAALLERAPKLTVVRGTSAESASITVDGVELERAAEGTPRPVDPGEHVVEAKAEGRRPFHEVTKLAERESHSVTVVLEAEPVAPVAPVPVAPAPAAEASASTVPGALPWIVGGVGAASLVASGVFFALRAGTIDDLDGVCGAARDNCPSSSKDTFDRGKTYTVLADLTLGVGIVGVGAAAYLLVSRGGRSTPAGETAVVPAAPNALAGASIVGRF